MPQTPHVHETLAVAEQTKQSQHIPDGGLIPVYGKSVQHLWLHSQECLADMMGREKWPTYQITNLETYLKHNGGDNDDGLITKSDRDRLATSIYDLTARYSGYQMETAYIACRIFDRFASRVPVKRTVSGLVALTSFWLASKLNEAQPPAVADLVTFCGPPFQKSDFHLMETTILKHLNWDLNMPTPHAMAHRMVHSMPFLESDPTRVHNILTYSCVGIDLSALDAETLKYRPSEMAVASILFGFEQTEGNEIAHLAWCEFFERTFTVSATATLDCFHSINKLYQEYKSKTSEITSIDF